MKAVATGAASLVWSMASWGARLAARRGLLRSRRLEAGRVISVGNIQVGGAGKTPLVARIANEGVEKGLAVCILCRGYGGEWESRGGLLAPGDEANALECGDEAALLRSLAPGAWIAMGADRLAQHARATAKAGKAFDVVVLDDGFQHWKIEKDVEVVAVTSHGPSEVLHRDFHAVLKLADLVVWTKGLERPKGEAGRAFVRARFALRQATRTGQRIWLVSGVGDPGAVLQSAREAGYQVERHAVFRDHAIYEAGVVRELLSQSKAGDCALALTGKDWVKWKELGVSEREVIVLEPEICIDDVDRAVWDRAIWGRS